MHIFYTPGTASPIENQRRQAGFFRSFQRLSWDPWLASDASTGIGPVWRWRVNPCGACFSGKPQIVLLPQHGERQDFQRTWLLAETWSLR
jgi:hypothetical protein